MEGTIENLKGFVTFLREGIIVVVLLLFLLLPKVMNGVLERAGFRRLLSPDSNGSCTTRSTRRKLPPTM
jgi:hypothetical protein